MTIIRRNNGFMNYLPSLLDSFFERDVHNWGQTNFSDTNTTIPAVNLKETSDNYEVEVAAPGMNKNDFKIQLEGNMLTISSERDFQQEEREDVKYLTREFSYQAFQRTFNLHKDVVDSEKIEAKYDDGVLHLLIPKKEEAKIQPKEISIQ